jgi:hypothetical protein
MSVISPPAIDPERQHSSLPRAFASSMIGVEPRRRAQKGRLRHILRGFTRVAAEFAAAHRAAGSFTVIGVGEGAEAIGATAIFPMLSRLTLVDHNPSVLARAAAAVAGAIDPEIELMALSSLWMKPMAGRRRRSDILYADLTELPQPTTGQAVTPRGASAADRSPTSHGLHGVEHFLDGARALLHPGGFALLLVSGRSGHDAIDHLAARCGFRIEIVTSGFERQADAKAVLTSYAAAESDDAEFEFYDFFGARTQLRQAGAPSAAETLLAPWRVSAREALRATAMGSIIGHRFHLLKAIPLNQEEEE